jgi:ATP-binding cassette subfamily B protein
MIIIMDGGMIAGQGTHESLLMSNDIYREIYEEQTKGGSDNE